MVPKMSVGIDFFHDRKPFIKSLIHSLNSQTFRDFEVIFMDDGPECGALDELKNLKHFFPIRYYYVNRRPEAETLENPSFLACGNLTNFVVDNMNSDKYIRCDPEVILPPNILYNYYIALYVSLLHNIKNFFVCGRYCAEKSSEEFLLHNWNNIPAMMKHCESNCPTDCGYFSCMAISKSDFQDIGGFTTNEKGWGGIDQEFTARATKLKYRHHSLPMLTIHQCHKRNSDYKMSSGIDHPITNPKLTILESNL